MVKKMANLRRNIALAIFAIMLAWPPVHMIIVHKTKMSSWRLFGWGMYASPNPEAQSRLRVVLLSKKQNSVDINGLHEQINKLSLSSEESTCVNIFEQDASKALTKLSPENLCDDDDALEQLDKFTHLGSMKHLDDFTRQILARMQRERTSALAYFTHQHFNIFTNTAYLESDVYHMTGEQIKYLGKVQSGSTS